MVANAVTFNESQRLAVQAAIIEVCEYRNWNLLALHVRTQHVHVVVTADASPERLLNDFKSSATCALRRQETVGPDDRVWSRHGSTRYLWKEDQVTAAIDYVVNRQGVVLIPGPVFSGQL